MHGYRMFEGMHGTLGSSNGFSSFMFIPALVELIFFAVLIYAGLKFFKTWSFGNNSAMKILNEKYASGEIDEEEYLKRKTLLQKR